MSSSIEWTNETWNPTVGCTRVSAGCDNCYAVRHTRRLAGKLPIYEGLVSNPERGKAHFNGTVRTLDERLDIPLGWRKPRLVFVDSMSDLFHPEVPFEFLDRVFAVMAMADRHTFQILTKRPERMAAYFDYNPTGTLRDVTQARVARAATLIGAERGENVHDVYWDLFLERWPLPNVWLGTSVESQDVAYRILDLIRAPAALRFLSCEPLIGPLHLGLFGTIPRSISPEYRHVGSQIGWVIVGGESGPGARRCDPEWIRRILIETGSWGMPTFVKQLGSVLAKEIGAEDRKGGKMEEWPEEFRVRYFPGERKTSAP